MNSLYQQHLLQITTEEMLDICQSDKECGQCTRKSSLITKYLHLIELLKKKSQKSHHSTTVISNKNSIADAPTVSQTSSELSSLNLSKFRLLELLLRIQQVHKRSAFKSLFEQTTQSTLALLVIRNRAEKYSKRAAFGKLKQFGRSQWEPQTAEETQTCWKNQEFTRNQNSAITLLSNSNISQKNGLQAIFNTVEKTLQNLDSKLTLSNANKFGSLKDQINRENHNLSFENQILKRRVTKLQKQLEETFRRQEKESEKKKESLEMLAEDIAEKNEMVIEMQNLIKFYESRVDKNEKVLEDQFQLMRKEVETLERVNQKLQFQLQRATQKSLNLSQKLAEMQKNSSKTIQQNEKLKYKLFQFKSLEIKYCKLSVQLEKGIASFKNKIEYLKQLELKTNFEMRKLAKYLPGGSFEAVFAQELPSPVAVLTQIKSSKSTTADQIENEQKLNILFTYLAHFNTFGSLTDSGIKFPYEDMLDAQQQKILKEHLMLFQQNHQISCLVKAAADQKAFGGRKKTKIEPLCVGEQNAVVYTNDVSDQICHDQGSAFDSVLDIIDANKLRKQPAKKNTELTEEEFEIGELGTVARRQPKENLTMKLLQIEIEKSKLIEKISDLKNKYMHIRNIVYNLLKSLNLSEINLVERTETLGVLEVVFDVFEYSEQEKEQIFCSKQKKKKFFGFFD